MCKTCNIYIILGIQLNKKVTFLSTAVIVGLLQHRIKVGVNCINAPVLAKEAGIELQQKHEDVCLRRNVDSALVVNIAAGEKRHEIVGLIAGDKAFLGSLDGADFFPHVELNGKLLLCRSDNSSVTFPKLIGLFNPQDIQSIWCSSMVNNRVWYVFNVNKDDSYQKAISSLVDFCAFITL
ncbi:D-3-phosphoglycerate dehydrogenase-like [Centruroides sculpturatus]|uniref:D-3-phosphoglycerate dehydrogenase-like n=1 Tax=Centruroides sculpturatus TaxID=218467 RepID=UPI000C6CDB82|nr:D-3-phosphoglycerate dehydrogenase-like [Centruroides sculpturatus]